MNLLGSHILVAKAPGHHSDEQGEEGTEIPDPDPQHWNPGSRIWDTGELDELTWRLHTRSQSSRPSR